MKKLFTTVSQNAAFMAVAISTLATPGFAQTMAYPSASAVQQVLAEKMGDKAKELVVSVDQGTVNLSGWVHGPREVHQARYLVSKLPGVERSYSSGVRTWVTTDPTPVF